MDDDWASTWLGRHWMPDRGQAYRHDGDGMDYIVVKALVDTDGIDPRGSVLLNMLSVDFSESEILVRDETEVDIVSIHCHAGLPAFEQLWSSRLRAGFSGRDPDGPKPSVR